ncbi:hypothetical protein ACLB2K_036387 [Fragaria x ananassa]
MNDSDSDDEDNDDADMDGEDDEMELGLDDEGLLMPFGEMKRWLEKKPRGFGEGTECTTLRSPATLLCFSQKTATSASGFGGQTGANGLCKIINIVFAHI